METLIYNDNNNQLNWSLQNMTKSPAIIFSFHWHVKWQVFGATRRLISFMNSAIEFRMQQVTRGSHHFFFKDCRSCFKKVMQPVLPERFPLTSGFYIFYISFYVISYNDFIFFLYRPGWSMGLKKIKIIIIIITTHIMWLILESINYDN